MKFEIRSRGLASQFKCQQPWACISIATIPEWPVLDEDNRVGVLQLCFQDIEFASRVANGNGFTVEQAQQILEFTKNIWDKAEVIMVHCDAGLSRSPAVAAALEMLVYEDDKNYFRRYTPNMLVYRTLLNEGIASKSLDGLK